MGAENEDKSRKIGTRMGAENADESLRHHFINVVYA